jgi:hypothetical protein
MTASLEHLGPGQLQPHGGQRQRGRGNLLCLCSAECLGVASAAGTAREDNKSHAMKVFPKLPYPSAGKPQRERWSAGVSSQNQCVWQRTVAHKYKFSILLDALSNLSWDLFAGIGVAAEFSWIRTLKTQKQSLFPDNAYQTHEECHLCLVVITI